MDDSISKTIGRNIRKHRISRKMTREELAEALDLDTAYLGQCERGERQLGLTKTIEIIRYFGITANDIISVNVEKETSHKELYIQQLHNLLDNCSDNQLCAVVQCVTAILPFLKD